MAGRPPEEGRRTVTVTTTAVTVIAVETVTAVETGIAVEIETGVETATATDMEIVTVRKIGTTARETADEEDEMIEIEVTEIWALTHVTNTIERRGTMTKSGEMTGIADAKTGTVEAAIMIVGATVIATVTVAATGKPAFNCILMAGISLISSLVVGRFWFKVSETYQSRLRTIRKAVELPMHLNLL